MMRRRGMGVRMRRWRVEMCASLLHSTAAAVTVLLVIRDWVKCIFISAFRMLGLDDPSLHQSRSLLSVKGILLSHVLIV